MWTKIQIGLGVLAFLLLFLGDRFSLPLLLYTGMACFGMVSLAIGLEAIITRHIVVGRRRSRNRGTYIGIPAIFHGVQFCVLGFFLIIISVMIYMRANSREFFLEAVRRPGLPLVCLGLLILMQAVITLIGPLEQRSDQRRDVVLNLLSRLLPGAILALLGLAALGFGVLEIAAPNVFDSMGGGFLETLYGLR